MIFFVFSQAWAQGMGKFYVVGVGPGEPDLITLRGLEIIEKADVILCSNGIRKEFSSYLEGKYILCDPWEGMWSYHGIKWEELSKLNEKKRKEWEKYRIERREKIVDMIKAEMAKGKKVVLLDEGDPCVFGPSHWFIEGFKEEEVEIVPGVSAFNAAAATLKKSMIPAYNTRFVMLTAPFYLFPNQSDEILKCLSRYQTTMVFFMALGHLDTLVSQMKLYYPDTMPIAIVYYAGYKKKQKIIRGTLRNILKKAKLEKENWLGMVIIGNCLEGKPYRTTVEKLH